jgi:hypothetical protein
VALRMTKEAAEFQGDFSTKRPERNVVALELVSWEIGRRAESEPSMMEAPSLAPHHSTWKYTCITLLRCGGGMRSPLGLWMGNG